MDNSWKYARRTWTDQQLARAVRDASSWRGVLGNLGLRRGGPNEGVKRDAARLGLDTSHFGALLRCTDDELRSAVETAQSWPRLLTALGLRSESRRGRAAIAERAEELGIPIDHLGAAAFRRRGLPAPVPTPDLDNLRDAAEMLFIAWLQLRGLKPAVPLEPEPYDFLLDTPGRPRRVQVKSTTQRTDSQSWQVGVARHAGSGKQHKRQMPYNAADVDLFAIVDGALSLYFIPQPAIAGRLGISLRRYQGFLVGTAASLAGLDLGAAQPALMTPAAQRPAWPSPSAGLAPDLPDSPASTDAIPAEPSAVPLNQPRATGRWPEAELRRAAADARSWADLLRAFGYTPGSTNRREALRRELAAHGIDTSHFTGRRTWSDAALIAAAAEASTWAELLGALGLAPHNYLSGYEHIRQTAARLGVSLNHLSVLVRQG